MDEWRSRTNPEDSHHTGGEPSGPIGGFGKGSFLMPSGFLRRLEKQWKRWREGEMRSWSDVWGNSATLLNARRESRKVRRFLGEGKVLNLRERGKRAKWVLMQRRRCTWFDVMIWGFCGSLLVRFHRLKNIKTRDLYYTFPSIYFTFGSLFTWFIIRRRSDSVMYFVHDSL